MSKLSQIIKNRAKLQRRQNKSLKLTDYQNQFANQYGYPSYKALLQSEKASEMEARKLFANKGYQQSVFKYPDVGHGVTIFVREDGLRGLKATKNFKATDKIITDALLIGFNISSSVFLCKDPAWAMAQCFLQPNSRGILETVIKQYNLRASHRPKLDSVDQKVLNHLSESSNLEPEYIRHLHSMITTYYARLAVCNPNGERSEFAFLTPAMMFMNHSCDANASYQPTTKFNRAVKDLISISDSEIIALKDIREGEEITWCYDADYMALELKARRKSLKARFDFDCRCELCFKEKYLMASIG